MSLFELPAVLLPLRFDAASLQADLIRVPSDAWQLHFNPAIYEGDWSAVALRIVPGSHVQIFSDPAARGRWEDAAILGKCAYFQAVLAQFQCPLQSVRLLRLAAGARIHEHQDYGLGFKLGEVRLHVVVTTNPDVQCRIDGRNYHWASGECWYADFGRRHAFANLGSCDRVHLVLDCQVNRWLLNQLENAAIGAFMPSSGSTLSNELPTLAWLRDLVWNDPSLQEWLFGITEQDEFIDALCGLAAAQKRPLYADDIRLFMRYARQDWFERSVL